MALLKKFSLLPSVCVRDSCLKPMQIKNFHLHGQNDFNVFSSHVWCNIFVSSEGSQMKIMFLIRSFIVLGIMFFYKIIILIFHSRYKMSFVKRNYDWFSRRHKIFLIKESRMIEWHCKKKNIWLRAIITMICVFDELSPTCYFRWQYKILYGYIWLLIWCQK